VRSAAAQVVGALEPDVLEPDVLGAALEVPPVVVLGEDVADGEPVCVDVLLARLAGAEHPASASTTRAAAAAAVGRVRNRGAVFTVSSLSRKAAESGRRRTAGRMPGLQIGLRQR